MRLSDVATTCWTAFVALAIQTPLWAIDRTWDGEADTNWFNPTNWTPDGAPSPSDNLTVPTDADEVIAGAPVSVFNHLTVNGGSLAMPSVDAAGSATIFHDGGFWRVNGIAAVKDSARLEVTDFTGAPSELVTDSLSVTDTGSLLIDGGMLTINGGTFAVPGMGSSFTVTSTASFRTSTLRLINGATANLNAAVVQGSIDPAETGHGVLEILDGATLNSDTGNIVAISVPGSSAAAMVSGPGAAWHTTSDFALSGQSTLTIEDGATVTSDGLLDLRGSGGLPAFITVGGSGALATFSTGTSVWIGGEVIPGLATIAIVELLPNGHLQAPNGITEVNGGSELHILGGSITTAGIQFTPNDLGDPFFTWSAGDITITRQDLHVGSDNDIRTFLGQAPLTPVDSTLTIVNDVRIGDPATTGPGSLTLDAGSALITTDPFSSVAVGSEGILTLQSATVQSPRVELATGATLQGHGTVDTELVGDPGSVINSLGLNLTLGDPTSFLGFDHRGMLIVANGTVTLHAAGFARPGSLTTINAGTLNAPNGIALPLGAAIEGLGVVNAKIAATAGATIAATGPLTLGDPSVTDGFFSDATLHIRQHTVTLQDANLAVLGSQTNIGSSGTPGVLIAANGLLLEFGKNVAGHGTIDTPNDPATPLINNGHIAGNSPDEPITLNGYVKGVGTFANIIINGTLSPGLSPGVIDIDTDLKLAPTAHTILELAGAVPGAHDQINVTGALHADGALTVELLDDYHPTPGSTFQLLTFTNTTGYFSQLNLPHLHPALSFDASQLLTTGSLTVIPEPATLTLIALTLTPLPLPRTRKPDH